MRFQQLLSLCAAFVLAGAAAGAQSTSAGSQETSPSGQAGTTGQGSEGRQAGQTITVTGCLATETDALGRRGLAVGADELVLTELRDESAGTAVGTAGESTEGPGGLESTSRLAQGMYVLTGEREDELQSRVGKRVEITGRLTQTASTYRPLPDTPDPEGAESEGTSSGQGSGGDDAGDTSAGATNTGSTRGMEPGIAGARSPDDRAGIEAARRADAMPHLEIDSFREVEGSCPSSER